MARKIYGEEWLNIVNAALSMISADQLAKLDEGTLAANYANTLLQTAIKAVYSTVDFYDIAITEELPRLEATHPIYAYCYKLPELAAKTLKVTTIPCRMLWELSAGMLCTDACRAIIKYVALPSTPEDIPPYAEMLIELKLAALLAVPVAHDETRAAALESQYSSELSNVLAFSSAGMYQEDRADSFWTDPDGGCR